MKIIKNCKISEQSGNLKTELKKEILKKAAIYKKQSEKIKILDLIITQLSAKIT